MDKKQSNKTGRSGILRLSDRIGDKVRGAIQRSAIGNFFSSYDKATERFEQSVVYTSAKKAMKHPRVASVRRAGASCFDRSYVRRAVLRATSTLRHCTMRFYGMFLFSFSLYVFAAFFVRKYGIFYSAPNSYLLIGLMCLIMSLPLLFDKKRTLGTALLDSRFFSWLLFEFFELRYEDFRDSAPPVGRTSIAFITGMVYGCLSFFISPSLLLYFLVFLVFLYLTLVSPESGLLLCLFSIPLLSFFEHPTIILCVLVLCVVIGYAVKLFRHKRVFHFGILEGLLMLFMLFVLFGGMRNASMGVSREMMVMIALMSGAFLSSNLLRTKSMILHAVRAFTLSCVISSVVGIAEYVLGFAKLDWLDTSMFSDIEGRAVSFFENPNVLGTYLCFGAPLSLVLVGISKEKSKTRWFFGFALIVACCVLTWSRGAWIGLAAAIVMLFVCTRHTLAVFLGGLITIPFATYVIPQSIIDRFYSIGDLADTSTMYRMNIWRGCFDMALDCGLGGIGVGEDAFLRLYPKYAVAGAETAYHSHSLWLQICLMLGVCGLALFLMIVFFLYQRAFTVMKNTVDSEVSSLVAGVLSAISGLLVAGLFDYTWYNYRVFFAFFILIGLVCSCELASGTKNGGLNGYEQ